MPDSASPPLAQPFRFPLRVYWEDTDAGGVVFYANYLKFFERARTEWLRSLGHQQERLRVETGVVFVVTDTAVRYVRPARLDDLLEVTVRIELAGRAQLVVAQQAWKMNNSAHHSGAQPIAAELVAEGTIRIGCVDAGTFKPQRIPISITGSINPTHS
jgi:acyl-CoA thioester hydrolase